MAREPAQTRAIDTAGLAHDAERSPAIAGAGHERLVQLTTVLDQSPGVARLNRTAATLNSAPLQRAPPSAPNRTGLPDRLKAGVESLSGVSLDTVRVHLNSTRPALFNAAAYAQGDQIHVAPGQVHHLPHEAWHVAQQAKGQVKPTGRVGGVAINDDPALEREADRMGALAPTVQRRAAPAIAPSLAASRIAQLGKGKVARMKAKKAAARTRPTPATTLDPEAEIEPAPSHATAAASSAPIQRLVIRRAATAWLPADFDTADLLLCRQVISGLRAGGKRQEMMDLHFQLSAVPAANRTDNDKALIASLDQYLSMKTGAVTENAQSTEGERTALEEQYRAAPAVAPGVRAGLRMWISGDPHRGVNWRMIGEHLRGRLGDADYQLIGTMSHARDHPGVPDPAPAALIALGRQTLANAANDISGAMNGLPDHVGTTFRQAGVANARVYGGAINLGDYIRDAAFWSTSALRITGAAGGWGVDGTKAKPKVYFIIAGSTGKYISKAAAQEEGQHEVLYDSGATFRVTGITNVRSETIFVYITQVDPATLPANTVIRNPFNGDAY